jgi:hypothetical protein
MDGCPHCHAGHGVVLRPESGEEEGGTRGEGEGNGVSIRVEERQREHSLAGRPFALLVSALAAGLSPHMSFHTNTQGTV